MSAAAAALARAEAAGVRLHLRPDGRVEIQAAAPPPADVLAALRRWREDVARLLAARAAVAGQRAETAPPSSAAPTLPPPQPDVWLAGIAQAIRHALAAGAIRLADEAGHLVLVRPDGRHLAVAPHIVEQLAQARLLPPLPPAVAVVPEPDPIEQAEREAVRSMPPLPPEGSPERARLDAKQAEMVRGLLSLAAQRPPCFAGEARRPPPKGSFCSACKGRRWWFTRRPAEDGSGPSPHWRCAACRPPDHQPPGDVVEART